MENTPQKNFKINLTFELTEKKTEQYSNEIDVFKNNHNKTLICDSTSTKEEILEEIKNHFQSVLKEFSQFVKKRDITDNKEEKETEIGF